MKRLVSRKKLHENNVSKQKSYYYKKYYNDIIDAIKNEETELVFHDGDCEIVITMHYKVEYNEYYRPSGDYDIPSEKKIIQTFTNIIVEIETFEDFYLPDIENSWVNLVR